MECFFWCLFCVCVVCSDSVRLVVFVSSVEFLKVLLRLVLPFLFCVCFLCSDFIHSVMFVSSVIFLSFSGVGLCFLYYFCIVFFFFAFVVYWIQFSYVFLSSIFVKWE